MGERKDRVKKKKVNVDKIEFGYLVTSAFSGKEPVRIREQNA